jgi:AraC-like DNA-binding protein
MRASEQFGLCSESSMPSLITNLFGELDQSLSWENELGQAIRFVNRPQALSSNSCDEMSTRFQSLFRNLNIDQIQRIVSKTSPRNRWATLVDANCERIPTRDIASRVISYNARANQNINVKRVVDEILEQNRPLSINYSTDLMIQLRGANRDSLQQFRETYGRTPVGSRYVDHASVIVGRSFNYKTGNCEYRVRNSWGKACPEWLQDYRCENGYFRLTEHELNLFVGQIDYISPRRRSVSGHLVR